MAKISRPVVYTAVLAVVGYTVFAMTQPGKPSTTARHKTPASKKLGAKTDLFAPQDYTAKFARLAAPMPADANDFLWQWGSSADYDAAPGLEHIEASLLAINSADDERNPPETELMVGALKRVKDGKLYLIPASDQTSGHLTTGNAKFYAQQLEELLRTAPAGGAA